MGQPSPPPLPGICWGRGAKSVVVREDKPARDGLGTAEGPHCLPSWLPAQTNPGFTQAFSPLAPECHEEVFSPNTGSSLPLQGSTNTCQSGWQPSSQADTLRGSCPPVSGGECVPQATSARAEPPSSSKRSHYWCPGAPRGKANTARGGPEVWAPLLWPRSLAGVHHQSRSQRALHRHIPSPATIWLSSSRIHRTTSSHPFGQASLLQESNPSFLLSHLDN